MTEAVPGWEMLVVEPNDGCFKCKTGSQRGAGEGAAARRAGLNTMSEFICVAERTEYSLEAAGGGLGLLGLSDEEQMSHWYRGAYEDESIAMRCSALQRYSTN